MSPTEWPVPLPLIPFSAIMSTPLPPMAWLVEPLLTEGSRVVLYGEFGALKSWLLLDLALHLASGLPWLGKFPIPHPRRVLYLDEDMREPTLRRRVQRLGAGLDGGLPFGALSRLGVRFDESGADRLLEALAKSETDPEVIIVETLRRVLVGSENEAADVAAFWRHVEPLQRGGRTLIVSHHMRKRSRFASNATRERASGSTDILGGADTAVAIHRVETALARLDWPKSRDAEEPDPFLIQLHEEGPEGLVEMRFGGSPVIGRAPGRKRDTAIVLVEEFLRNTGTASREAILAYLVEAGYTERTGERALQALRKSGRAAPVHRGRWHLIEADGLAHAS